MIESQRSPPTRDLLCLKVGSATAGLKPVPRQNIRRVAEQNFEPFSSRFRSAKDCLLRFGSGLHCFCVAGVHKETPVRKTPPPPAPLRPEAEEDLDDRSRAGGHPARLCGGTGGGCP